MLIFIFVACSAEQKTDSAEQLSDVPPRQFSWELAFEVAERPYDLAVHPDGRIFCSAQGGSRIYHWDPQTDVKSPINADFDEALALKFAGETMYYTTSDNGVTGALLKFDGNESSTIASQASNGTLFRWPMDLLHTPNGEWLLADYNAGVIFSVLENGQTTVHSSGSTTPETLAWADGFLYIGGEDGIWKKQWPDGEPEQLDSRSTYGLININGTIWATNSTDGVFPIGDVGSEQQDIARPSSPIYTENVLYVADRVGQGVWKTSMEE